MSRRRLPRAIEEPLCQGCDGGEMWTRAEWRCEGCNVVLCDGCLDKHGIGVCNRVTKLHVPLEKAHCDGCGCVNECGEHLMGCERARPLAL